MYRIIKNNETYEEQEKISWVKYQEVNSIPVLCEKEEGEAILIGGYSLQQDLEDKTKEIEIWSQNKTFARVKGVESSNYFSEYEEVEIE